MAPVPKTSAAKPVNVWMTHKKNKVTKVIKTMPEMSVPRSAGTCLSDPEVHEERDEGQQDDAVDEGAESPAPPSL